MQNRFAKKKEEKKNQDNWLKIHIVINWHFYNIYIFVGVIWKNGYKKSQIQIMQQQCVL